MSAEQVDKDKLNKKLAEWRWPEAERIEPNLFDDGLIHIWRPIDFPISRFTNSPDACCKWLVPKRISGVFYSFAPKSVFCGTEDLEGNTFVGQVYTKSIEEAWAKSAEALCLAIEKLIDAKEKPNA